MCAETWKISVRDPKKVSDTKIIIAGALSTCSVTETTTVQAAGSVNEEGVDSKSNEAKQKKSSTCV